MNLRAQIEINGVNPYVLVPSSMASALKPQWRRPIPVLVKVNGMPESYWRINMVPRGDGDFYLYLHNTVRVASATGVGDIVDVEILFDQDYKNGPQHEMPGELSVHLANRDTARKSWDNLSPSRQKEVLRYLANIKSDEAKRRNIDKTIQALSGESIHFMGRDWQDGR
jgi:hypothetical protein